jgi:hypothetical protein
MEAIRRPVSPLFPPRQETESAFLWYLRLIWFVVWVAVPICGAVVVFFWLWGSIACGLFHEVRF